MGNSLATGKASRRKAASRDGSRRAADGMEGCSQTAWGAVEGNLAAAVGTLTISKDSVRWVVAAQDMLGALGSCHAEQSPQQCYVSQLFAMPVGSVRDGCRTLIGAQKWQLCWEAPEGGEAPAMSLYLRSLSLAAGQPAAAGSRGMQLGVCCEFSLDLRAVVRDWEGSGRDSCCLHRREWLSHAFTRAEPDWGLRAVLTGVMGQQAQQAERVQLEVELRFEGVAAHVQGMEGELSGLVLQDAPLLLQISETPCILAMDDFLTPGECQDIVALSEPQLKRSKVSAGDETPLRTSSGMFITGSLMLHPTALHLDARVQQLADTATRLKGRRQLALTEATQVVRYYEGEYYAEHYDNKAGDCAKRAATIMVYLSDVPQGGATAFSRSGGFSLRRALESCVAGSDNHPAGAPPSSPASVLDPRAADREQDGGGEATPSGLRVTPRQGRAIVFWSRLPNGKEDKASMHAAEAVGSGGIKWIATRWCQEC